MNQLQWITPPIAFASALVLTAALTALAIRILNARRILDRPNERSSHARPTPRGGGLATSAVLIAGWLAIVWFIEGWATLAAAGALGALLLAAISWIDDLRNLGAAPRLLAQALAVAMGLVAVGPALEHSMLLLPIFVIYAGAAIGWLWYINLFNFMDGIDGISGIQTASIGLGLIVVGLLDRSALGLVSVGALFAGIGIGFLMWNWHPAKIFLGDVGSVPLGYLTGCALLALAAEGQWAAALILPLYYLADATYTLIRRLLRGAKPWHAHKEHFYQKATQAGLTHAQVSGTIALGNGVLIVLAGLSVFGYGLAAFAAAVAVTALLIIYLATRTPVSGEEDSAR